MYLGCEGWRSYSSSASAAVAAAAARSDGRLACSPHRARGSSLCAAVISHLSCSACVCVVSMQRLEKGGRGGVAHVLLLADCEYAEGDECAPQEGLAAGSLGEAEEAPDVLTLRGVGGKCQSLHHLRERRRACRGETDGVAPCFHSRVELRAESSESVSVVVGSERARRRIGVDLDGFCKRARGG